MWEVGLGRVLLGEGLGMYLGLLSFSLGIGVRIGMDGVDG